jgi:photosystem II stability/assembly factor-like uncharacterized protein
MDELTRRKRRALALGAGAAIVLVVAGFVYLRGSAPRPSAPVTSSTVKPGDTTSDWVMYDFPSPAVGWAMRFSRDRPGVFVVSRTVDGGRHWEKRLVGDHGQSQAPLLVRFFDDRHGFVASGDGLLLRTSDGGVNWRSLSLPELLNAYVIFRNAKAGWLMAPMGRPGGQPVHLYATDDAGDSWQKLPDPPPDSGVFALRRNSEAWIASRGPQFPRVYRSIDGGIRWEAHDLPVEKVTTATGPWNTSVVLLPGDGVIASVFCQCPGPSDFNFTSFDAGATWRVVPPPPGRGLRSMAYSDDVNWWTIYGPLYRSSDAGQTWTRGSDNLLPDWGFQPRAIDAKHAWAQITVMGGYGLATTADAGLHWTRVTLPPST